MMKIVEMLALWEVWMHRNNSTFRGKEASMREVLQAIRRGIDLWRQAGAPCLLHPFTLPPEGIG